MKTIWQTDYKGYSIEYYETLTGWVAQVPETYGTGKSISRYAEDVETVLIRIRESIDKHLEDKSVNAIQKWLQK
jgi:hypothetical protein